MDRKYISGLDGLRAIAVIWVVFFHVTPSLDWSSDAVFAKAFVLFSNSGWVGVQLFFVLSGFLITGILLDGKGSQHQLRNFYLRRSLRIFPLYYLTLFVCLIVVPLLIVTPPWLEIVVDNQIWWWTYLMNWTRPFLGTNGLGHFWSLAIEEQFYLFWPLIVVFRSRRTLCWVIVFMLISAPVSRYLLYNLMPDTIGDATEVARRSAYNFTIARWDALAQGALLSVMVRSEHWQQWLKQWSLPGMLLTLVLVAASVMVFHNFAPVSPGFGMFNQTLASVLFFFVLSLVIFTRYPLINRVLDGFVLQRIGKYSYAIYILHLPVMLLWKAYTPTGLQQYSGFELALRFGLEFAAIFLLTLLGALLSWRLIEHPCLKLKSKFAA